MAEAPRKLTIKLRPVGAKPAEATPPPAAATPAPAAEPTPAPEPMPAAPADETLEPIAELPEEDITTARTIPLKKPTATPAPTIELPTAKAEDIAEARTIPLKKATPPAALSGEQAKRQTSRVQLPEGLLSDAEQAKRQTSRMELDGDLKPVSEVPTEEKPDPQAAKSKTARIALDSVLGGIQANSPLSGTTQKTIKLKRASAAPAKPTVSAPMPSASAAPAGDTDKTIKLKKPGVTLKKPGVTLKKPDAPAPADEGLEALDTLEPLDDIATLEPTAVPKAEESLVTKIFTIAAIAAAVVGIVLCIVTCMVIQKQAASPDGSAPTGNTLHTLSFQRM